MTELREKVRERIANAAQTFDSIQMRVGMKRQGREAAQQEWDQTLENTTDAIMALLAGGSGEVSEEAVEVGFDILSDTFLTAKRETVRDILAAAYAIDRPAPVVDWEAVERVCRNLSAQVFNQTHSSVSFDGMLPYQKAATDAILSAVNAVSEAQVRADERERLAERFDRCEGELIEDTDTAAYMAAWLRAQEGGK